MTESGGRYKLSHAELVQIPVGELIIPDNISVFSYPLENAVLTESVRKNGIIQPLLVNDGTVICGVKRLASALAAGFESVPALTSSANLSDRDRFELALEDNSSVRSFNIAEAAGITAILKYEFGLDVSAIDREYSRKLGISGGHGTVENLISFHGLEPDIKDYCVDWNISVSSVSRLFKFDNRDRKTVFDLIKSLNIHGGKLKKFLTLLYEIMRMEQSTVSEILNSIRSKEVVGGETATQSQKTQKLFELLQRRRYPKLTQLTEEFEKKSGSLQQISPETIKPPAYFEGDSLEIRSSVRSLKELDALSTALQNSQNRELIRQLLDLL